MAVMTNGYYIDATHRHTGTYSTLLSSYGMLHAYGGIGRRWQVGVMAMVAAIVMLLCVSQTGMIGVEAACPCTLTADQTCDTTTCSTCKSVLVTCNDCYTGMTTITNH